jgi:uncharacterized protein YhbP (UPF0306 family)
LKPLDLGWLEHLLADHWVLTLATAGPGDVDAELSCAPLFYAFIAGGGAAHPWPPLLVFASHPDSEHGRRVGAGPTPVAAAIAAEARDPRTIRGVQLRGWALPLRRLLPEHRGRLRRAYLRRHPVAAPLLMPGRAEQLYLLVVGRAKATDNRWGLGCHPTRSWEVDWNPLLGPSATR